MREGLAAEERRMLNEARGRRERTWVGEVTSREEGAVARRDHRDRQES